MTKYLLLILLPPAIYFFAPILRQPGRRRAGLMAVHAVLLTYLAVFVLNRSPLIFSDELNVIQFIHAAKQKLHHWKGWFYEKDFIPNHFLLVDTSYDPVLVPNPEGDQEDSTFVRITDRRKLTRLLDILDKQSGRIDLVVCDILFQQPTPHDSLLNAALQRLAAKGKLVVAYSENETANPAFPLPPETRGRATEELRGDIFFSHTLQEEELSSLPYLMYRRLNDIEDVGVFSETRPNGDTDWYLNTFIPELPFSDEERLLGNAPARPSETWLRMLVDDMLGNRPLLSRQRAEMAADGNGPLNLGYLLTESGQTDLAARLEQKSGPYRIVFIGAFQDPENDVHNTVFGAMHGSVILLNIFYELQQGHHHVSLPYLAMLLVGFWYITRVLVRRAVRIQPEPELTASRNWLSRILDFFRFLWRFVFEEERHVWLLLVLVILADLLFGHIINIMGLAIYLVVFDALLRFFSQRRVA